MGSPPAPCRSEEPFLKLGFRMNANAVPLLGIFEKKLRLEVPLFQRQYVWNKDDQWEPLWEDISRKFTDYLSGRKDSPVHFLGAMVLDQKQTPTTHVELRQVIDGQQRLTTLQIFLAAFRDVCRTLGANELAEEVESFTLNKGMMANPEMDRFKVWPTKQDRSQFVDVLESGSREEVERRHPLRRRKWARNPDPRPAMVEAYLYFYEEVFAYFQGTEEDLPLASDYPVADRMEEAFQALKNALQVVAIDLDQGDDAQVIFETLNARGQPLLPADLLRNYIFLRAARAGENTESLYEEYWSPFDEDFWRKEVRQGRLWRPRSDLFLQHFLASRQGTDIPIRHLFVEYKYWVQKEAPFGSVREELGTLARQGADFRRIIDPEEGDPIHHLATFLERFDLRTAYPLLLYLLEADVDEGEWFAITRDLESYVLRRAVCGYTTKNYNRVFLNLTRQLRRDGASSQSIRRALAVLTGESAGWPSDADFRRALIVGPLYRTLNAAKLGYVLERINQAYMPRMSEDIRINSGLTVEHLMPQGWIGPWPLPDGSTGLSDREMEEVSPDDPRAIATRHRDDVVHSLGNLTLLTQGLNSSVSNGPWGAKRTAILSQSLLPINAQLREIESWDEEAIHARGERLADLAIQIWSRPRSSGEG